MVSNSSFLFTVIPLLSGKCQDLGQLVSCFLGGLACRLCLFSDRLGEQRVSFQPPAEPGDLPPSDQRLPGGVAH